MTLECISNLQNFLALNMLSPPAGTATSACLSIHTLERQSVNGHGGPACSLLGWTLNSYIILLITIGLHYSRNSQIPQLITTSFKNQLHHISHKHLRICLAKSGFIICIFLFLLVWLLFTRGSIERYFTATVP